MMNELERSIKELENNKMQETENGALAYSTSNHKLLDMNFKVASYRSMDESVIVNDFNMARHEDETLAAKFMFFLRDVRGGLGERRSFRVCLKTFVESHYFAPNNLPAFLMLVPQFGRWDDLIWLYDNTKDEIIRTTLLLVIKDQLAEDSIRMANKEPISLLAKWMPRINTSSKETKRVARMLINDLNISEKAYRKTIANLNKYIDTVEIKMSAGDWEGINYEKVASKANILYKDAFFKHDPDRRAKYLVKLKNGEATINSSAAYPHDIIHKYCNGGRRILKLDWTLESMWTSLPDYVKGDGSTLVVCDSSGSMGVTIGSDSLTAREVAYSLAIYFAQRAKGEFKGKFITFSENPKFIDISRAAGLMDAFNIACGYAEVANTNIEKTLMLILDTAIKNNMDQSDMPTNILIISDMEFDLAVDSPYSYRTGIGKVLFDYTGNQVLFDYIGRKFKEHGYKMPRLVFWNVNSRTCGIPVKENELGVALVSGFSPSICNMVLSTEIDPWLCLLDVLNSERYAIDSFL